MLAKCPFTEQEIDQTDIRWQGTQFIYSVNVDGERKRFSICDSLCGLIQKGSINFNKDFVKLKKIILWEWLDNGLENIGWNLHWTCKVNEPNHACLDEIKDELLRSTKYPGNRKQLQDNFLKFIAENQEQDGGFVKVNSTPTIWGKLFFKNYIELQYYIEELEDKGLIKFTSLNSSVQLTFQGLDYVENLAQINKGNPNYFGPSYDIGLSFAGEQREYVDQVAKELDSQNTKVFYDFFEQHELWGKDLYQHLNEVYRHKCKFCIVFLSKEYAKKLWTRHELEAAQARAFMENEEYILPVKFDDTEIPGINPTTGYLDANNFTPKQIAEMVLEKLRIEK